MNAIPKTHIAIDRTLTQDDFDAFAALSGDDNPIHVDPTFSARTNFGRTVSHGMLLYTILRGLADQLAPGARQVSQELKFPAPAYAGEPIRFEASLTEHNSSHWSVTMRATRTHDQTSVCEGLCILESTQRRAQ
ncbi:MAG: hydratase [Alphaproteobacteria bacterium]|nr:hydratase [Alphaproteobacteria bacterium]